MNLSSLLVVCSASFFAVPAYCQPELTKKNLKRLFRGTMQDKLWGNVWIASNRDSAYYMSDTIILFNDGMYYYNSTSCHLVKWEFNKRFVFRLIESNMCTEPPIEEIASSDFKLKLRIFRRGEHLGLIVYQVKRTRCRIREVFVVTDLRYGDDSDRNDRGFSLSIIRDHDLIVHHRGPCDGRARPN